MARKKQKRKAHGTIIKVAAYPDRVDARNPWHVFFIILILVVIGAIAIWMIRMLLYVVVILGAGYILYLMVHKQKK